MTVLYDAAARKLNNADFQIWDIFEETSASNVISFEDGRVDKIMPGIDFGIGIRGIRNNKTIYGYTNDPFSLDKTVSNICAPHTAAGDIVFNKLIPSVIHPVTIPHDFVAVEKKINMLREIDAKVRSKSVDIRQVTVNYIEKTQDVVIYNDKKEIAAEQRVYTTCAIMVIAQKNGRIETGYSVLASRRGYEMFELEDVFKKADEAANLALKLLTVDKKIAGPMTAVMSSSAGGTMIHEAVGHSLEADLVQKGVSQYNGKKGQKVASEIITVIDDSTIPGKRGSLVFDDEGTRSQRTVLIENGILKNYMYDRETAMKDKTESTGNGRRESYKFKPIPRMRNTMIAPGFGSAADLIKDTKKGIFVVKMGGGQVNTVTGEFVFEVKDGYMIENGIVTSPVRGATLMGTGVEVLNTIDAVCSDLGFDSGTCGKDGQGAPVCDAQPTIRIPRILVGSK
jgi:TldD protein